MEISKLFGKLPKGRRKRMELYLLNDNVNSFDYVIQTLTDLLPICNILRAQQIALLVDGAGDISALRRLPKIRTQCTAQRI